MSNTKHLADLLKVCSILPALVIMPAMAAEYTSNDIEKYPYVIKAGDSLVVTEGYSNAENGVFHNNGSLTIRDGLVFDNNNTDSYGATIYIYNEKATYTSIGNGVVFSGGTALKGTETYPGMGGAIYSWSAGTSANAKEGANVIEIGNNVVFRNNSAIDGGSAIYTYGYNTITIGDNLLMENHFNAQGGGGGGAIVLNGYDAYYGADFVNTLTVGKNATFKNNTALLRAGAIYVGGDSNDKAVFDDGAHFSGNSSSYGGAAAGFGAFEFGTVSFDSNVSYSAWEHMLKPLEWEESKYSRYAGNGGAVLNSGEFVIKGDASFTNNCAEGLGGAIYNTGTMEFQGDVVFSGNKNNVDVSIVLSNQNYNGFVLGNVTGGTPNDIHNIGTLTIVSGETMLDGGITGNGALDIKSGATLNINYASIEQDTINIDGILMASLLNDKDVVDITGALSGTGTVLLNAGATGIYDVSLFADANLGVDFGKTYDVEFNDDKTKATLTTRDAQSIAADTGASIAAAGAVSGMAASTDATIQQVSLRAQAALNNGDIALVEKEMAKANPDTKPVSQSVAASVQNQVVTMAAGRMSAIGGGATGRAGGDVTGAGVWTQGMFNKSKFADKFHGYTRGFAIGGDTLIDNVLTIGGGYAFSNSDIHADGRNMDVENNSIFMYAQYKPAAWYVNATLNYTKSDYADASTVFGYLLNDEYETKSYGAQAMFGYDFANGVTPEFGMRYLHVSQEDHVDVMSREIAGMDTDFLSGVAGLKYAFTIESDSAVKFSPSMRAAMTYDFLSDDATATVVVPGASAYYVNVDRLSRLGGEFGIGLTAEYRGLEVSLNYELDLHQDYTSQTGLLKFRYDF